MHSLRLAGPVLLFALAACARDGTGAGAPSWFRASLTGEVTAEYEGTGDFSFTRDDAETPRYFRILSTRTDPEAEQTFHVRWPDDRRPTPGVYALVPHADRYGSNQGVTAVYGWSKGDNVTAPAGGEVYVATGGEVEITRSTPDEVEGRIAFSGIQVTKQGPWFRERDDPRHQPDPSAPTVQVTGTFRLTRFDESQLTVKNQ